MMERRHYGIMAFRHYGMKIFALCVCLLIAAASWADFPGEVVAVKDGDTLEVLHGRQAVRVRLYGIDCPEKKQAYGQRAKQAASALAFGKAVTVREHGRDRYGRTIGEVFLPDGRSLNRELVRLGLAWWYRQYAKHDAELEALEREARANRAGLWADADPVPPWSWRKRGRK